MESIDSIKKIKEVKKGEGEERLLNRRKVHTRVFIFFLEKRGGGEEKGAINFADKMRFSKRFFKQSLSLCCSLSSLSLSVVLSLPLSLSLSLSLSVALSLSKWGGIGRTSPEKTEFERTELN